MAKPVRLWAHAFKAWGCVCVLLGVSLLVARFYCGVKPEILNLKVFAIYSVYLEARVMTVITNQVIEEIGSILLLSGLLMLAFARERTENEAMNDLRLRACFTATYGTFIFMIFAILFTYGFVFVYTLTVDFVLWLLIYIIAFRLLLYRNRDVISDNNKRL